MNESVVNEITSKFTVANALLEEGKFTEAKSIYEELLENDPTCLTALAGKLFAEDEIGGIKNFKLEDLSTREIADKTRTYMALAGENEEFFKKYNRCLTIAHKMKGRNEEIASLNKTASEIHMPKEAQDFDITKYYIGGMHPEEYEFEQMKLALIFAAIAVVSLFVGIFLTPYAFIVFLIALVFAIYKFSRMAKANNIMIDITSITARAASNQRRLGDLNIKLDALNETNAKETKAFGIHVDRMKVLLDSYEADYEVLAGVKKFSKVQKLVFSEDDRESGLFAHTCPNCAGKLVVQEEDNTFACTSCGSVFEIEYFMGEDLTNTINVALENKEFVTAMDMCEFALSKNPKDIRAKFFKLLAEDNIGGIKDLNSMNFSSRDIKTNVSKYLIGESGERKLLFDEYFKGIKVGKEMRENDESLFIVKKRISNMEYKLDQLKVELEKINYRLELERLNPLDSIKQKDITKAIIKKIQDDIGDLESEIKFNKDLEVTLNKKIAEESRKIGTAVIKMKGLLKIR